MLWSARFCLEVKIEKGMSLRQHLGAALGVLYFEECKALLCKDPSLIHRQGV